MTNLILQSTVLRYEPVQLCFGLWRFSCVAEFRLLSFLIGIFCLLLVVSRICVSMRHLCHSFPASVFPLRTPASNLKPISKGALRYLNAWGKPVCHIWCATHPFCVENLDKTEQKWSTIGKCSKPCFYLKHVIFLGVPTGYILGWHFLDDVCSCLG